MAADSWTRRLPLRGPAIWSARAPTSLTWEANPRGRAPIPVSAEEELARVLPVLEGLRGKLRIPISLDTQKAVVAEAGIGAGVEIINDVSGLRSDPGMAEIVRRHRVGLILMHMRGTPETMHKGPFAAERGAGRSRGAARGCLRGPRAAGIAKNKILIDPGIGFGKRYAQNFEVLAHLPELARLGYPLVVGTSQKGISRLGAGWEKR